MVRARAVTTRRQSDDHTSQSASETASIYKTNRGDTSTVPVQDYIVRRPKVHLHGIRYTVVRARALTTQEDTHAHLDDQALLDRTSTRTGKYRGTYVPAGGREAPALQQRPGRDTYRHRTEGTFRRYPSCEDPRTYKKLRRFRGSRGLKQTEGTLGTTWFGCEPSPHRRAPSHLDLRCDHNIHARRRELRVTAPCRRTRSARKKISHS